MTPNSPGWGTPAQPSCRKVVPWSLQPEHGVGWTTRRRMSSRTSQTPTEHGRQVGGCWRCWWTRVRHVDQDRSRNHHLRAGARRTAASVSCWWTPRQERKMTSLSEADWMRHDASAAAASRRPGGERRAAVGGEAARPKQTGRAGRRNASGDQEMVARRRCWSRAPTPARRQGHHPCPPNPKYPGFLFCAVASENRGANERMTQRDAYTSITCSRS